MLVTSRSFTAEALRHYYRDLVTYLRQRVDFFREVGIPVLHRLIQEEDISNAERIAQILYLKATFGVPIKDQFLLDDEGRVARLSHIPIDEPANSEVVSAIRNT